MPSGLGPNRFELVEEGIDGGAAALEEAARRCASTFTRTFTANGFQRYPTSGGVDSPIAYLSAAGLVPDRPSRTVGKVRIDGADERRTRAFTLEAGAFGRVWQRLIQPAGGIKPGHG